MNLRSCLGAAGWAASAALWTASAWLGLAVRSEEALARFQYMLVAAATITSICAVESRGMRNYRATLGLLEKARQNASRIHALTEGLLQAFAAADVGPEMAQDEQPPLGPALHVIDGGEGRSA